MKAFAYTRAASVEEAVGQLTVSGRETVALSGGVDLMDLMKEGLSKPDVVVALSGISGLDAIETLSDGTLRLGARVTLARIAASDVVDATFPALSHAAGGAATPQIRNMATLGGNLLQRPRCWYFRNSHVSCLKKGGSSCPAVTGENRYLAVFGGGPCFAVQASSPACALVALDAVLNITGEGGARQVPLSSLYQLPTVDVTRETTLEPGDLITSIDIPAAAGSSNAYVKLRAKESFDWAMSEVAVRLRFNGSTVTEARIVMGGVAPIPWRATDAEAMLIGKAMSSSLAASAAAVAVAQAQPLSNNAYKIPATQHLVESALLEAAGLSV